MTMDVPPVPAARSDPASTWTAPPTSPLASGPEIISPLPPTPPAFASTTAPAPSVDPTAILDELVASVAGVRSAILASVDGFGLARSTSMSDEPAHPAMLAAAIGLAHQLVAMGGGDQLRQLVVDHDGGLMLVWPIGDQRVLAVLSAVTVEQRQVRSFVQTHAMWLSGAPR